MDQSSIITAVTNYFTFYQTQLIDVHVGNSICFIVKHADMNVLETISSPGLSINVLQILPSTHGQYHYIFVEKV